MKIGIVVNDFPVLSETFIIRMIEDLSENSDIHLVVIALGGFNKGLLPILSNKIYAKVCANQIEVVCAGETSGASKVADRLKIYVKAFFLSFFFFIPVLKAHLKEKIRLKTFLRALHFCHLYRRCGGVDILHAQYLNVALAICVGKLFAINKNIPVLSSVRGFDIGLTQSISPGEVRFLNSFKDGIGRLLSVSESLLQLAKYKGLKDKPSEVLYSGLNLSSFSFRYPSTLDARKSIEFVQVGRLVDKKGVDLTLSALSKFQFDCEWNLSIIGDGPLRRRLEAAAVSLGIINNVHFLGPLSHVETIKVMERSDILLVPSRKADDGDAEGIPNVAKEAMAIGVVVIASDHSGLPEIVQEGVTGFLFPENNLSDYVEAIKRAVADRKKWDSIAVNARAFIFENFDSKILAKKLLQIYKSYS